MHFKSMAIGSFEFGRVLGRFKVEIAQEIANVAFSIVFLTWVLVDKLKKRSTMLENRVGVINQNMFISIITPLCNTMMPLLYLFWCFYEFIWYHEIISYGAISTTLAWIFANLVLLLSRKRTLEHGKRWPMVLVLWWFYSLTCDLVVILYYIITNLTSSKSNIQKLALIDVFICPLLILLCFNALPVCGGSDIINHESEQPLLVDQNQMISFAYTNCNSWSKLTFSWLNPLFTIGRTQLIELVHIPPVPLSETAENASIFLEESLELQHKGTTLSLPKAILSTVWRSLITNALFACVNTVASYTGPVLITHFVDYLLTKSDNYSYRHGVCLAAILFLAKTIESVSQRQCCFGATRIAIQVRAALIAIIYQRTLNIKGCADIGEITNLIATDADKVGDLFLSIHGIWLFPIQIILGLVILTINLGIVPAIVAFSSTVLVTICNTPLAHRQERLHSKIMEAKDSRMKATTETLKSMKVLKLHSWEFTFMCKLLKLRETENFWLSKCLYTRSAIAFLFWASPALVSVVTFGVCVYAKTPLTSGTVLSALATFKILQEPIYNLPDLISTITQTRVSIARIEKFISDNDQTQKRLLDDNNSLDLEVAVDIEAGEYGWDPTVTDDSGKKTATISISKPLRIRKGSKVVVCGSVGSGKSSLLSSIMGEIPRIFGKEIKVFGTKSYVAQTAWIQTGTVRDNVLFGKEMNEALYEEVLEACALKKDLEMWEDGDMSVVGERGINLSGGQKQRIQLARAIYSDADVYFLDDPFSAVDAHTCAHLFKRCLMQMLSQKTVIYITHQLEFLDVSDLVLVIKDGLIVQSGRYHDLISDHNGDLFSQMTAHRNSLAQVKTDTDDGGHDSTDEIPPSAEITVEISPSLIKHDNLEKQTDNEEVKGRVNWRIYWNFITVAYGGALVPVILLCQIIFSGLQMASSYWIAWATEEEGRVSKKQLLGYYFLLCGGSCVFILGRTVFLTTIAVETGHQMYLRMISSVFRAPITFFDFIPSSRILSRSSTDQSIVDLDIPYRLAGLVFALIQLLYVIFLLCRAAWQVFLIFAAVIAISLWYQEFYIATARELARMVGTSKPPILHHLSESMMGAPTIRCFNQKDRFYRKVLGLVNDYSRVTFHNTATMEWFSVRTNFLFNLAFFIVLVILVGLPRLAIEPSLSGLIATYGLNMNVLQAWVIWNLCNVENKMISVERILDFTRLRSEAPMVVENNRPTSDWPTEGTIQFENLHVQYSQALPMVLKGITFAIPAMRKVGIVGRTGCGKSTLIQALFRVVDPCQGHILVDGLNICEIGLKDLRSKLSIIPQDPILFQGTVRANLDPLEEHSDQEIWEVLNKCHGLVTVVKQDQRLLDAPVTEDGRNWSVGQRQLVCLARVLLQRRRILVLDEATASVDTATDNMIQATIREETTRCTVITVAHRIPTVIYNDLVLVLDQGKIKEYDSPSQLLKDTSTGFAKLVKEFHNRSSKNGGVSGFDI